MQFQTLRIVMKFGPVRHIVGVEGSEVDAAFFVVDDAVEVLVHAGDLDGRGCVHFRVAVGRRGDCRRAGAFRDHMAVFIDRCDRGVGACPGNRAVIGGQRHHLRDQIIFGVDVEIQRSRSDRDTRRAVRINFHTDRDLLVEIDAVGCRIEAERGAVVTQITFASAVGNGETVIFRIPGPRVVGVGGAHLQGTAVLPYVIVPVFEGKSACGGPDRGVGHIGAVDVKGAASRRAARLDGDVIHRDGSVGMT